MEYIIGIDTGGTFTDVTVIAAGKISFYKSLTTPGRLDGVFNALQSAAKGQGVTLKELLSKTTRFIYSSTFATNLMVERANEGKAGALATKGFGDTLIIRRSMKNSTWDSQEPYPQPLIPRRLTREVIERVDYNGQVVSPLDINNAKKVIDELCGLGIEAVAICLLHSYANPNHERELKKIIEDRFPNIFAYCSSDISPEIREYERMSTTAFAAYVGPGVERHLSQLETRGRESGLKVEPLIMQSSGGVMGAEEARRKPVAMLFSGPAGGVIGSHFLSRTMGIPNFLTTDMGGTSFDVGLVKDGEIQTSTLAELERWALMGRRVDLHTIGAGGGSIAYLDPLGIIKVGPRSAGAEPGPACYNRGGTEPTVTDADVVLGYLDPDYFLGGQMKLNEELAHKALKERIGKKAGMSAVEVASGIYQIINAKMVDAMRVHSVERGHDPRDFVLLGFGGAGPVHAAAFHAQLGTKSLIIPALAPVFSSMGVLATNLKHSYSRTYRSPLNRLDLDRANSIFYEMENEARPVLQKEGIAAENIRMERSLDMSYSGQIHELEVPVPDGPLTDKTIKEVIKSFSQKYLSIFGYQEDENIIQVITFRLEGIGLVPQPVMEKAQRGGKDPKAAFIKQKEMYLPEEKRFTRANVYDGEKLVTGNQIAGPAIIQYTATTAVIFPGQKADCDEWHNLVIK